MVGADGLTLRATIGEPSDSIACVVAREFISRNLINCSGTVRATANTSLIVKTPGCAPADAWRLYERVLVCLLTENTDFHLKNFAMLHTPDGMRLSPAYDLVAAALYPAYRTFALSIDGSANLPSTRDPKWQRALN
jgi:hypothetical protein